MPNWRSSQNPQVSSWANNSSGSAYYGTGIGLEHLTVENTNLTSAGIDSIIEFGNVTQSWVKNVRTINGPRRHISFIQAIHIEIRDSYFCIEALEGALNPMALKHL
ncbi:MAG: hypothetical protein C5B60_11630 [Chloroflexi bacterium]|nr:MAG: hypothetical protein C5B60_11630 [Chloroflexota bacterium]